MGKAEFRMESTSTSERTPAPADDPETQLMLRFAAGESQAFDELVDQCEAGLIQYFVYLTRNRATAEDLAQDVFIRIFQAGKGYQPKARFRTWLFRIARNLWIDHCRREQHSAKNLSLDATTAEGNGLAATLAAPAPETRDRDEGDRIRKAIEQLPMEQREVVLMSQIQGLLYEEVAEALEIPVGTVKSRMHHALKRLREILGRNSP